MTARHTQRPGQNWIVVGGLQRQSTLPLSNTSKPPTQKKSSSMKMIKRSSFAVWETVTTRTIPHHKERHFSQYKVIRPEETLQDAWFSKKANEIQGYAYSQNIRHFSNVLKAVYRL